MKKSLRYLVAVLVLAFALTTTGCLFGDPGADLVGTWVGTVQVEGVDQPVRLELMENYYHTNPLLIFHGYAYAATLTVGAVGSELATWITDVPTSEERAQLFDLLLDYVKTGELPSEPPAVDVAGWGAIMDLLTGDVTTNKFILFIGDVQNPGTTAIPVGIYGEVDGNTLYLEGGMAGIVDVTGVELEKALE